VIRQSRIVSSDAVSRLKLVKRAGARSERETAAIGCADDSLLDPVDQLRGLAHMDVLLELVDRSADSRVASSPTGYLSAASRHAIETGHRLQFGCCSESVQRNPQLPVAA